MTLQQIARWIHRWYWEYLLLLFAVGLFFGGQKLSNLFVNLFPLVTGNDIVDWEIVVFQWIIFSGFIVIIGFAGYLAWRKNCYRFSFLVWSSGALLISIYVVWSVVSFPKENCAGQWLYSFGYRPWESTLGRKLIAPTVYREALLWSPGMVFIIFLGVPTILGYVVAKRAVNILLMRLTSASLVSHIGHAMNEIKDKEAGKLDMILASPVVGNITDKKAYNMMVKEFWKWIKDNHSCNDVPIRIICLTEISAADFYKELGSDLSIDNAAYKESEDLLTDISGIPNVKIKRRDNLPMIKMVLAQSPKKSIGIVFFAKPLSGKLRIQGYETKDSAVIDTLVEFFDRAWEDEEPITRIEAFTLP